MLFLSALFLPLLIGVNAVFPHGGPHLKVNKFNALDGLGGGRQLRSGFRSLQEQPEASTFPDGIWDWQGYGRTIDATVNSTGVWYDETNISCMKWLYQMEDAEFNVTLNEDGNTAELVFPESIASHILIGYEDFQKGCMDGPTPRIGDPGYERDPLFVFDMFVQYFSELFAHFEVYGVDWQDSTDEARKGLTGNSTDEELTEIMLSVLAPMKGAVFYDGVEDGNINFFWYSRFPPSILQYADAVGARSGSGFNYPVFFNEMQVHWASQEDLTLTIAEAYLDNSEFLGGNRTYPLDWTETNVTETSWGTYVWGTASDGKIGFLHVIDWSYFADLDEAMFDLEDTEVLIIDVRQIGPSFTPKFALALAAYFTDEPYLAFTRKAVVGDGYTRVSEVYVNPNPDPMLRYDGKIILMTSELTPDILSITMAQLPQVTLLGQNSWGDTSFNDGVFKDTPNNFSFWLSNQVWQAPDGTCYDGTGVPPDILVETEFMNKTELDAGVDTWLELALKTAQQMIDDAGNTTDPPEVPSGVSTRATLHALAAVAAVAVAVAIAVAAATAVSL